MTVRKCSSFNTCVWSPLKWPNFDTGCEITPWDTKNRDCEQKHETSLFSALFFCLLFFKIVVPLGEVQILCDLPLLNVTQSTQ